MRIYLLEAYQYVSLVLRQTLHVRFDSKVLDKRSLGQLLHEFKKFCDDDLASQIHALIQHRNNLAHGAYYQLFTAFVSKVDLEKLSGEADDTTKKVITCTQRLEQHIERIGSLRELEAARLELDMLNRKTNVQ
jgi:hypothetical protein